MSADLPCPGGRARCSRCPRRGARHSTPRQTARTRWWPRGSQTTAASMSCLQVSTPQQPCVNARRRVCRTGGWGHKPTSGSPTRTARTRLGAAVLLSDAMGTRRHSSAHTLTRTTKDDRPTEVTTEKKKAGKQEQRAKKEKGRVLSIAMKQRENEIR